MQFNAPKKNVKLRAELENFVLDTLYPDHFISISSMDTFNFKINAKSLNVSYPFLAENFRMVDIEIND